VGAFAARTGAPEPLRIEAVNILGVWAGPSPLDRVDGAQLAPPAPRDAEAARAAVLALVDLLAADETATPLKTAIIDAVARLDLNAATPALLARLERDRTPAVRVSALRALEALGAAEIQRLLPGALADPDPAVRRAAIGAIRALPLSDAEKADYLVSVVGKGSTGEQQSALDALGGLQTAAAADRIGTLLDRVAGGTLAPEVMLDLFEAARANGAEPLLARLDRLGAGRKLDNLATTFPAALTRGGTASRGRQVALEHEAAQCVRCHTIGKQVSTVGPPLDGIGSRLADLELLEAIVNPSARIAPGFGMVAVTLRNGRRVEGVLHEETGTTVIVEDGASVRHRLDTSAIASRTNLPSAMPPMGAVLTPAQLRDVVAYLSTLN
jgi:putative heme-binding domain-containing protein